MLPGAFVISWSAYGQFNTIRYMEPFRLLQLLNQGEICLLHTVPGKLRSEQKAASEGGAVAGSE